MTDRIPAGAAGRKPSPWATALLAVCPARVLADAGAARAANAALPANAGGVSRFLADLSSNHPLAYALLSFLVVTVAALALSILAERLMKRRGALKLRRGPPGGRRG
jgi:hypothetical protein